MYAAMWSEHCSYKSSKVHLRTLPTDGPAVLVGPGQDAGVVDVGDGFAAVFKIESHSHPSAIEPYQGAATGVGGIVRDIVSMGARPVALLDPLMFGPLDEERNRWLLEGVVADRWLRQLHRRADGRGRGPVRSAALGEPDRQCALRRHHERRSTDDRRDARPEPGLPHGAVRGDDRTRRDRWRLGARVGHDRGRERGIAPLRADRRPVRGEALIEASLELIEEDLWRGSRTLAAPDSPARSASPQLGRDWARVWISIACRSGKRAWRRSRS